MERSVSKPSIISLDYWTHETRVSENERRARLIGERGRRAFQFDDEWLSGE
jgi:hypothetical protein